jgi:hypothetical protein
MDAARFDRLTRLATAVGTRRGLLTAATLAGLAGAFRSQSGPDAAGAARKRRCNNCCRRNGSACKRRSPTCKRRFCLRAPVTIEAIWTKPDTDHESYLFVPNEEGASLASPYIHDNCNPDNSDCEEDLYPFACVSQDADGPPGEITTIRTLLPGTYEFWMEVYTDSPPDDLRVRLRDRTGRVVRAWTGPETGSFDELNWHVFDFDGSTGRVTSVNQSLSESFLPLAAHDPATFVCAGR